MDRTRATGLLLHEDKLLMIHRFRDGEEYYVLPGGGVEKGETPQQAILREIKEETSLEAKLKNESVIFTDNYTINGEKSEHQLFECEYISGEPKLSENSIEISKTTENNTYEPLWMETEKISKLNIKPEKTKDFLISYLKK